MLRSLRGFEPWPPWEKDLLTIRAECYATAADPRADRAGRELAELLASQPEPLLR